jgi:hypothetical protein
LTGFIDHRLPNLTEHGERVPPIRRNGNEDADLFSEE